MGQRKIGTLAAMTAGILMMGGVVANIGGGSVSAQDMETMAPHPAHIHVGTCDAPGEVVFPLSDVGEYFNMDGTPMASEWMGPDSAIGVEASVTTVGASLADIVSGGHTIVIHESAENIGNYVACGDIGGMMLGGSDLPVGIAPLNDSGESGIAILHDNGDGTTMVSVFITSDEEMMGDSEEMDDMEEMATPTS